MAQKAVSVPPASPRSRAGDHSPQTPLALRRKPFKHLLKLIDQVVRQIRTPLKDNHELAVGWVAPDQSNTKLAS